MLVTDVLEELGYHSLEAGDSIEGLKILQSNERVDLLVTDVDLPGCINGRCCTPLPSRPEGAIHRGLR
jgi:CheY-like chemotaxis protein